MVGVLCSHVDDFFYGGTENFLREVIGRLRESLEVGSNENKVQIYRCRTETKKL